MQAKVSIEVNLHFTAMELQIDPVGESGRQKAVSLAGHLASAGAQSPECLHTTSSPSELPQDRGWQSTLPAWH